ncbi:regulator of chromosome condensation 1/beta-lactamase-inhibitor protein II [Gloeopeniophorella convolvens]|nr:regulator of chromosome condensation 1/beta-lactamase-inhibitor protein II [Gloeopeniophorella convolvens]
MGSLYPLEILLHHLLVFSSGRDIRSLGCTSRFFAGVCSDETLWRKKCEEEFTRFTSNAALQRVGWKKLFIALSFPRIFVLGHLAHGRRGAGWQTNDDDRSFVPVEVKLPGVRVVRLVAGPWSFSALDSEGSMFVWGALDGDRPMIQRLAPFSLGCIVVKSPRKLILPNPVRDISYGNLHCTVLDSRGQIWTFTNWFRPFRLESAQLDCHSPETTPTQVACGPHFSAVLTQSGDVFVFFPFNLDREDRHLTVDGPYASASLDKSSTIQCITRTLRAKPHRLPSIPTRLDGANDNGSSKGPNREFLIRIAALSQQVIGLTNNGHLLIFKTIRDEASLTIAANTLWKHLAVFCEPQDDMSTPQRAGRVIPQALFLPPISEIATHFPDVIVAYSPETGSMLIGRSSDEPPVTVPGLRNRTIASVALGKGHRAVLTADGELLTWGAGVSGALGHGAPTGAPQAQPPMGAVVIAQHQPLRPPVPQARNAGVPTPVHFDHGADAQKRLEMFCIDVTARESHTGALVVNLERNL